MINYGQKKKSSKQPSAKEFLSIMIDMLKFKREFNDSRPKDSLSAEELTNILALILGDEIDGSVYIKERNVLTLHFFTGERFNLTIEKISGYNL